MQKLILAFSLIALMVCPARADLKDYIDDQTVIAGEADLSKVDPAAFEQWWRKIADAMGLIGDAPRQTPAKSVDADIARMKSWLAEFTKAGGKHIYLVTTLELMKDGACAIIAPADTPEHAKALAGVLFSGKADGPESRPNMTRQNTGQLYPRWAQVIRDGKAAVYGTGNARQYAATLTPKDRPDIAAALASAGVAPARITVVPNEDMRDMVHMFFSLKDVKWLTFSGDVPPKASLKVTAQATSAAGAKNVAASVQMLIGMIPPSAKFTPQFIKLITPAVTNDQLVLALDDERLMAIAAELKEPLREARAQAQQVSSMSNMRQILVACIMYSSEHKGAWPDDLKSLEKYLGGAAARVLANPRDPNKSYVYVEPLMPLLVPANRLVLYEDHEAFGSGVAVGFADGHVELIKDQKRFDDLLAATKAK